MTALARDEDGERLAPPVRHDREQRRNARERSAAFDGAGARRAAIVAYTHMHELKRHNTHAVRKEWSPLVTAINRRAAELAGPAG